MKKQIFTLMTLLLCAVTMSSATLWDWSGKTYSKDNDTELSGHTAYWTYDSENKRYDNVTAYTKETLTYDGTHEVSCTENLKFTISAASGIKIGQGRIWINGENKIFIPTTAGDIVSISWANSGDGTRGIGIEGGDITASESGDKTVTMTTEFNATGTEVTLTAKDGALYIYSILVYSPSEAVEAPTFSIAAGNYYPTTTVSISCATDGASIYYKEDGSKFYDDYSKITTAYSSARSYTSAGTKYLSVYAVKNGVKSPISKALYTIESIPTASFNLPGGTYNHAITLRNTNELLSNGIVRYVTSGSVSKTSAEFPSAGLPIATTTSFKAKVYDTTGAKYGSQFSATYTISIPSNESYTTAASGYTAVTSGNALDFTGLEVKAYIAKSAPDAGSVTLTQVSKVPANTSFILKGDPSTPYDIPVLDAGETDDVTGNLLEGDVDLTTTLTENQGYILSDGVFQPCSAGTLAKGKCYLAVTANARALDILFDDGDVTGIKQVEASKLNVGTYYNLAGQKVQNPTKGLYIVNGKKVIIK